MNAQPHDLEAEAATLGCCLYDRRAAEGVIMRLAEGDFYAPRHRVVFAAIKSLIESGKEADDVLLKAAGIDDLLLIDLRASVSVASRWRHYAEIVAEKARHRRLIEGINEAKALDDCDEAIATVESLVADLTAHSGRGRTRSLDAVLADLDLNEKVESYTSEVLPDCYMQRGQLVLIGARPSVGKSAMAAQIAYELANRHVRCRIWSYEMNADQYARRFIQHRTGFGFVKQVRGLAQHEVEYTKHQIAGDWSRFITLDDSNPGIDSLVMQIHRAASDGVSVIIIDHLHILADGSDRKAVTEATRKLKLAANDSRLCGDSDKRPVIILLAQFSRLATTERGTIATPTMQSFKESGSIEADADIAVLLHAYPSEEAQAKRLKWKSMGYLVGDTPDSAVLGLIDVAKNRYGRQHRHPAAFDGDEQRWIVIDQTLDGRRP